MNNIEILKKLSLEEKIAIASDAAKLFVQQDDGRKLKLSFNELDSLCGFSALSVMANCWNDNLAERFFSALASVAENKGVKVIISSQSSVKSTPYSNGLTEEPFINKSLIESFNSGLEKKGVKACIEYGIGKSDLKSMDVEFSRRAFTEYYMQTVMCANIDTFSIPLKRFRGEYAKLNEGLVNDFLKKAVSRKKGFVIAHDCTSENAIKAMLEGNILLNTEIDLIKNAVEKYQDLQDKINNGQSNPITLDAAVKNYTAISEAQLNQAVDRVIDFALAVRNTLETNAGDEDYEILLKQVSAQSIVLLKNQDILPIKKLSKILVVSSDIDLNFASSLADKLSLNSFVEATATVGYSLSEQRFSEVDNVIAKAKNKDIVLLALNATQVGINQETHKLSANQLSLIDRLEKENCKIIAFVIDSTNVDVGFDNSVLALLSCPSVLKYTSDALAEIMLGKSSPSGKLANTSYVDVKEYFDDLRKYTRAGNTKVGPFVGYRYYDSADIKQKYPFGFGLSYSKFEYSGLSISANEISFMITNVGEVDAYEVAQIYVGKDSPKQPRPNKELKGYVKVFLQKGQSQRVKIKLDSKLLAICHQGKMMIEGGIYNVSVGSSLTDIRLTGKIDVSGQTFARSSERLSEYLQSKTNVVQDGYTLTPIKEKPKALVKVQKVFGSIAIGIVLLELALIIMGIINGANTTNVFVVAILPAMLVELLVALAITKIIEKKKLKTVKDLSKGDSQMNYEPEQAQSFRDLFDGLFDEKQEDDVEEVVDVKKTVIKEEFVGKYDNAITFKTAVSDLINCFSNSGLLIDKSLAIKVLSSFVSSRVLLCNERDIGLRNRFFNSLGKYFGGNLLYCKAGQANSLYEMIYDADGNVTEFGNVLEKCSEDRDKINLVVVEGASVSNLANIFLPMGRFATSRVQNNIPLYYQGECYDIDLYPNVWFVLCPENGKVIGENLSFYNSACILNLALEISETSSGNKPFAPLNFYQIYTMEKNILSFDGKDGERYNLDEDKYWKKIDGFENFINGFTGYSFNNKFNLSLESYIITYLACGGEPDSAYDCAVTAKVLPVSLCIKKNNTQLDEDFMAQFSGLFGEIANKESKAFLSDCLG